MDIVNVDFLTETGTVHAQDGSKIGCGSHDIVVGANTDLVSVGGTAVPACVKNALAAGVAQMFPDMALQHVVADGVARTKLLSPPKIGMDEAAAVGFAVHVELDDRLVLAVACDWGKHVEIGRGGFKNVAKLLE